MSHIIEPDVITASGETRRYVRQKLCGKKLATRKNPLAIVAGSNPGLPAKP